MGQKPTREIRRHKSEKIKNSEDFNRLNFLENNYWSTQGDTSPLDSEAESSARKSDTKSEEQYLHTNTFGAM